MIRGAIILTVATFFSKFLGILFVIPYEALTGEEGMFLYQFAYTPYAIMLSFSTMGLPLAVSKFVSKYHALGDYETAGRMLKSVLLLMIATGIAGFLCLYFAAPTIVDLYNVPAQDATHVVLVMRVVSIAILIVPVMSFLRGYFQGLESMGPTAVSQTAEQVARIAFILISSYFVMRTMGGSAVTAAAFASFAAFIGAVAGLYVMMHFWIKRKPYLIGTGRMQTRRSKVRLPSIYKELFMYAVPFIAVGIAMQLYQAIDQAMVYHFMDYDRLTLKIVIGDLIMADQKLVMIPVTLATAMAASAVPAMIASFSKGERAQLNEKITQALQLVLFLTVPAAAGLSILSYMAHGLFYGVTSELDIGGRILRWYAPTAIFFSLFQLTASILQGINRQRVTLLSLAAGVALKIVLNPICMMLFGMVGPVIATDIGYFVSIFINFVAIRRATDYRYSDIGQQVVHIIAYTAIMLLVVQFVFMFFGGPVPETRTEASGVLAVSILAGGLIYLLLAKWTGLLRKITGRRRTSRSGR